MSRWLGVLALLCAGWSAPAHAQEEQATLEARAAFEQGENEYQRGHFALALQHFERSYELLEGHPRRALVLFNIGAVYEELGQLRDAVAAFRRYLEEGADVATNIEETRARITDLEARIALAERSETARGAPPATSSDAPANGGVGVGPVVLLGVGGAALAASAITGAMALGAAGDLENACPDSRCPDEPELRARADEARTLSIVTDVLWPIGAAAAAAGLVWLIIEASSGDGTSDQAALVPTLRCDRDGCVAGAEGRF